MQNLCPSQLDLVILQPKVAKNFGVAEICVLLGRIFGISLASGSKETWCFRNSCLSGSDKFCSVGELSCWGCELEIEWQIAYPSVTGKVQKLQQSELNLVNFGQFWRVSSTQCLNQNDLHAEGRAESTLLLSFLCKIWRC